MSVLAVLMCGAAVLTAGQFAPLNPRSVLRTGQCLKVRSPKARNITGPCSLPHRAQVVAALNPLDPCPELHEFDTHRQDLEIVRTAPIDDVAFCAVRPHDPTRQLSQAIYKKGLAPTF